MSNALRKAAEQAIDALECGPDNWTSKQAIDALRAALTEPEQSEPVAWRIRCTDPMRDWVLMYRYPKTEEQFSNMEIQPLFAAPPRREPLSDEQIIAIYNKFGGDMINCARSIERQPGIGVKP